MKAKNYQHTPLAKLISNLMAGVVIASLSTSAIANPINPNSKTPAQVEQALTALLDSRGNNLQLASYTGKQSSKSISSSVPSQVTVKKVDYSQKSIAELVLAGLAITNEAKDELSSTTTLSETKSTAIAQDYAVADIVTVEELDAAQESTILDADASAFTPIEETVSASADANKQLSSNSSEFPEDALPALPAPIAKKLNKEIALAATNSLYISGLDETGVVEAEDLEADVAKVDVVGVDVVELEIAQTDVVEVDGAPIAILEEPAPTLLARLSTYTQESPSDITDKTEITPAKPAPTMVTDNVGANVNVAIRSAGCPEKFNQVSIPVNGKLCQIFAADFPASMILFIPQTPEEVVQYYLTSSDSFIEPKKIKNRTMLKSADNNTTLIISKDGGGTQVDILVKSPMS